MTNPAFGFETPEESPGFLLWQTTLVWQRLIKAALEPYSLSQTQFVMLAVLLWFEETKQVPIQSRLVNTTKLDKMTVSKSLKQLTLTGLISRQEDPEDSRAKSVRLTKEGRKLTRKLVPLIEQIDEGFFSMLKRREQKLLINFLNQLVSQVSKK